MADACRRNSVQLMDGVMWVHHKRTAEMSRIIDDGILGELRRVTAAFTFNWDTIPENNIRAQKEVGGGCLGDLGYYCVRAILWAFGDLPTRVFGTAHDKVGVEFNLSGLLWFANERMASFDCGFNTGSRKWFEVAGTKGSLICDDFTVPWKAEVARFWVHGTSGKDAEHRIEECIQEVEMIERFSNIVQTGQLDAHWPSVAVDTMRVCDALLESARQGEVKKL
jgi:predicted dehydrogenase